MEEEEEEEESYETYRTALLDHMFDVIEEHGLIEYYGNTYLKKQGHFLHETFDVIYKKTDLEVYIKKDSLPYIFTVSEHQLRLFFNGTIPEVKTKKRVELVMQEDLEKPNTLNVSFIDLETDDELLVTKSLEQEVNIEKIHDWLQQYKTVIEKISAELDHFIENTPLKYYYTEESHFSTRKTTILDWLGAQFRRGILLNFETMTEDYLYEDLFAEKEDIEYVLRDLINLTVMDHKATGTVDAKKRKYNVECVQMPCKSEMLLKQLNLPVKDRPYISNIRTYENILERKRDIMIDVCYLRYPETNQLCSITFFDKTDFIDIMAIINAKKQMEEGILREQDRTKIRRYASKESTEKLCRHRIDETLRKVSETIDMKIDEQVNRFLTEHSIDMSNTYQGLEPSLKVIEGCINRTVSKATKIIEDRGGVGHFKGNLLLTNNTIPISQINEKTLPLYMSDKETPLILEDYKKLKATVNTLNCNFGNDWLSQCVIPCVPNCHLYYVENMTVYNGPTIIFNLPNQSTEATKLKRKRNASEIQEARKKFRLVRSAEQDVTLDEDGTRVVLLKSAREKNPNWNEMRICNACEKTRLLKSFTQTSNKKSNMYYYINSVCNSCKVIENKRLK